MLVYGERPRRGSSREHAPATEPPPPLNLKGDLDFLLLFLSHI